MARSKMQCVRQSFLNAVVVVLWLVATCAWFAATVISAETVQVSADYWWVGALGLVACVAVSYALVPRWVHHLPGIIGYAIFNGVITLMIPSRFPNTARGEILVWIAVWVAVTLGLIYLLSPLSKRARAALPLNVLTRGMLAPVPMLLMAPALPGIHLGMWAIVMLTLVGVPALRKYWQSRKPRRRGKVGRRSTYRPKQPHFEDQPDR